MKLLTNITPRKEGVVKATFGEKVYVFSAESKGAPLVCDVDDEDHVARLLLTDNFEPADEADHDRAFALLGQVAGKDADTDGDGSADDAQDADALDADDDVVDPEALPLEANTPPKTSARPRKAR